MKELYLFGQYRNHGIWAELPCSKYLPWVLPSFKAAVLFIDMERIEENRYPFRQSLSKLIFELNLPFEQKSKLRVIPNKMYVNDIDIQARWLTLAEIMKS